MFIDDNDSENLSEYMIDEGGNDNENDNEYNMYDNVAQRLQEHVFCVKEISFLNNFFSIKSQDKISSMMSDILEKNELLITSDTQKFNITNLEYNIMYNKIKKLIIK